jgi:hypothetical protein
VSVPVGVFRSVVHSNADLGPQAVILAVVDAMMMITTMFLPIATTFEVDALVFTRKYSFQFVIYIPMLDRLPARCM